MTMTALQDFDQALSESLLAEDDAWTDDVIFLLFAAAAKLTDQDLMTILSQIWPNRPLIWQQHCAEVLGSNRLDPAIEILLGMMDHGRPAVAFTALASLQEFDVRRFTPLQTDRIRAALNTALEGPVPLLQRVVLEAFVATLRLGSVGSR